MSKNNQIVANKPNCTCGEPHITTSVEHCYDGKPCHLKPVSPTPQMSDEWWVKEFKKRFTCTQCLKENKAGDMVHGQKSEKIIDYIRFLLLSTRAEAREEYQEIFAWLLGENGDFPDLSQKPHYKFRTELRQRLSALSKKEI